MLKRNLASALGRICQIPLVGGKRGGGSTESSLVPLLRWQISQRPRIIVRSEGRFYQMGADEKID